MSLPKGGVRNSNLEHFYSPDYFHNHGDNPAYKKFIEIAQHNQQQGQVVDKRTYVIDKTVRFLMARNWEDFLQRDLKAVTFPRAFGIFILNSMALSTAISWTRKLLPVGKYGIRNVIQTSFYHNFGPIGLVGAGGVLFGAAYTWWKTTRFTAFKFYRHVIMGDRNWLVEQDKVSRYGLYEFSDNPLANEATFPALPNKLMSMKTREEPTYGGPYQAPDSS